jgi:Arc/MetJ-type ribon-helix-helix transcriptional regulator
MSTDMKRFTVSVTPEIEARLDEIKREEPYKPVSEIMRRLIVLGLDRHDANKNPGKPERDKVYLL